MVDSQSPAPGQDAAVVHFSAFPFQPYPIQVEFMSAVYRAIQQGGVAIVESPTGTGKTLSLICSALQWLEDQQHCLSSSTAVTGSEKAASGDGPDEPQWLRDFSRSQSEEVKPAKKQLARVRKQPAVVRSFLEGGDGEGEGEVAGVGSRRQGAAGGGGVEDDDGCFLLDDYQSEDEKCGGKRKGYEGGCSSSSDGEDEVHLEKDEEKGLKVFFCSRTHSQLSQFIGELQRTHFSSSLQVVSLGSRKTLCINPEVRKLGSAARMNERCLELLKNKTSGKVTKDARKKRNESKGGGCAFLRKQKLQAKFKEELTGSAAMDIEDLVQLGTKLGTCPYYGSRLGLPSADLVVLPYQSLLHASTRESLGLKMSNSVVIIDEAHNLVDAVSDIHSCQLSSQQLKQVHSQLAEYLGRFRSRLAAGNRRYIETILILVRAFLHRISPNSSSQESIVADEKHSGKARPDGSTDVMSINDFLFSLSIDNINIFKLRRYIKESNIVHKVSSYGERVLLQQHASSIDGKGTFPEHAVSSMTAFHTFAEFILALTNADSDGRVLVKSAGGTSAHSDDPGGSIKFMMLNVGKHFAEVLEQARAVVLAGGTLQPVAELRARLFPNLSENKVHMFSCGHIVPPESILPIAIARGPGGISFDFTYQSRGSHNMIEELGRLMSNICSVVPEGIVVFFPSFEYENQVFTSWSDTGVLNTMEKKKTVFREPRNTVDVEATLIRYKESITAASTVGPSMRRGAVLLCVVGGKMSEGINFSDGMGRCVVMVGLPYPSPGDPELMERMKYLDQMPVKDNQKHGTQRSKEYYENLCMKAVNQSIGRAIRHIGDYAAILLVDARYTTGGQSAPTSKLPGWIRDRLVTVTGSYGDVHKLLHHFFRFNRDRDCVAPLGCG